MKKNKNDKQVENEELKKYQFAMSAIKHFNTKRQWWEHYVDAGELEILHLEWNGSWRWKYIVPEKFWDEMKK